MIEVDSGGALVDKMPTEAMSLIANMVANSQQFGVRTRTQSNQFMRLVCHLP